MAQAPSSKEELEAAVAAYAKCGWNKSDAARWLGIPRSTLHWRLEAAKRSGIVLPNPHSPEAKGRRYFDITDGVIYVASDAHYWPGEASTAHRAFIKFIKREKHLRAVVLNGDAYDFPNLSRFDSDWFQTPTVQSELEAVEERLGEIVKASGKVPRYFTRGNHDVRFDRYLAKNAPEMRGISGMCIEDRNPLWEPCWSLFVNDDVVIKHRPPKGGIHSTTNSPLWSGMTTVCGHLHSLQCRPLTDYRGDRWGVDCGCLADIYGPQFSYLEDGVRNWRAGFARLRWVEGRLLTPEMVRVVEKGLVEFRGELVEV